MCVCLEGEGVSSEGVGNGSGRWWMRGDNDETRLPPQVDAKTRSDLWPELVGPPTIKSAFATRDAMSGSENTPSLHLTFHFGRPHPFSHSTCRSIPPPPPPASITTPRLARNTSRPF